MTRSIIMWTLWIVLCLIFQTTLVHIVSIGSIMPDLPIMILFLLGIRAGILPGIYAGFFLGLGQDLYSPSILGQNALAKTALGFFAGLFNEKLMRTDPVVKLIILLVAFVLHDAIFTAVTIVKTDSSWMLLVRELLTRTVPRALYSSVLVSMIYLWNLFVKPSLKR